MKGINLGSGKQWRYKDWIGLDELDGNYLDDKSVFPYEDNSIDYVYSSHFFEHVNNKTAKNLIDESYRVLKPGGVMRILVPNFQLMLNKYKSKDQDWFFNKVGTKGRADWAKYGIEKNLTNVFLHWLTNYDYDGPNGWARIPIKVDESVVNDKVNTLSFEDFCNWAQSQIPIDDSRVKTQHINWWNDNKFKEYLSEFSEYKVSSHFNSEIPNINNGLFDNQKREIITLYVESKK